ncbi:hypothetical protein BH708_14540 [Brachybacterium sp. P6-10-X1]|uniref:hypothetical protein n=1 Tax=Brachybacterium sp. P6-10-X1 TaxID=1903186 RepID=UPI000971BA49|nr:hypothetical protein [Brachybacterium sp. P6-10-X1]APX33727.1 hypothetical protein BH708_14540 [Brachybacterium sp. P6-10-X1]
MSILGGKDGRGPGGDPSWLGGTDRDEPRGTNWSSGFAAEDSAAQGTSDGGYRADSDFGGGADVSGAPRSGGDAGPEAPSYRGPQFGDGRGEEAAERGGDQEAGSTSSVTGQEESSDGEGSGTGIAAKMLGVLGSLVGLIVIVVVAYQMGLDGAWLLIFGAVLLVSRVARAFRGGRRR